MLPSQVLKVGNSIDIMCASLAAQFQNYQREQDDQKMNGQSGKIRGGADYSTDELQAMLNKVRE